MSGEPSLFVPTSEQAVVVQHHPEASLCVEAAAGSGKTGTMAALFAARVAAGVAPGHLMAVTFTEKAAGELRERIEREVLGPLPAERAGRELLRLERAWVGTFHQLALRLLRENAYRAGVSPELAVLDQVAEGIVRLDTVAALTAGSAPGPGVLPYEPDEWVELDRLDGWALGADQAMRALRSREPTRQAGRHRVEAAHAAWAASDHPPAELGAHRQALEMVMALWAGYEARLAAAHAVDFDGLLRLARDALLREPALRGWCRAHFDCIIVDEFQDTSQLQVDLLRAWARPDWTNVVVVGDPRQAIYGWRDAAPDVMAQVTGERVVLGRNHRSRAPILRATDRLIRVDPAFAEAPPVTLHRVEEPGVPVWLGVAPDPRVEAEAIASVLRTVQADGLRHPGGRVQPIAFRDCAVLAYTLRHLQAPLEEALRRLGIPYRAGGGALFERPEVQDLRALLRAATDPDDDQAWLRCAQGPWHRIPDAVICGLGPADRPLHQRMRRALAVGAVPAPWGERLAALCIEVDGLAQLARHRPATRVVGAAIEGGGLARRSEARARGGDGDGRRATAALRELQRLCLEAERSGRVTGLAHLLQRLAALAADERTAEPPPSVDEDAVTLLTVHRAKGLEFPFVILADTRPFTTPTTPAIVWDRDGGGVLVTRVGDHATRAAEAWAASGVHAAERAERRRVAYVGMTRARDALLVTTTARRQGPVAGAETAQAMAELLDAPDGGAARDGDDDFLILVGAMADPDGAVQPWPGFPGAPIDAAARMGPLPMPAGSPGAGSGAEAARALGARWRAVVELEERTLASDPALGLAPGPMPVPPSQPLSFTVLEEVQRCPRRAGYRRMGLPPTDPERVAGGHAAHGAHLGIAVHAILERLHRERPDGAPSPDERAAALDEWAGALGRRGTAAARVLLEGYAALEASGWPTIGVEVAFEWRQAEAGATLVVAGAIDRVARPEPGTVWLLDYKTGIRPDTGNAAPAAHQLRLYAMAWGAGLGPDDGARLRAAVVDLRRRRLIEVALDGASLDATRRWIGTAARRLHAGGLQVGDAYPDRPCAGCAYRSACPERRPDVAPSPPPSARR